ncbi:WPP domain-interacting tail-anchored protein 1 [Vitis vinifera]|uniref:WPP domain-interacting tail-anchored protein 1 n=1 Tax=Vitis vinifera TaxID=29760 RepID=A0A438JBZ7_VITVI|nr:WPP domain-interacting tail-anchored protein 1 [Vitis vinifera]
MDAETVLDATASVDDINTSDPEAEGNNMDLHEGISSYGEVMLEVGNATEVLKRVELDLACSSEKLFNLSILTMHVATRESDFEAFASEEEHVLDDSVQKALEFDLLSGILDSEVREVDNFMTTLQKDVAHTHEILSSCENLGGAFMEMEEKLHDSDVLLKQSQDHVSEIRMQSAKFQRTLLCFDGEGKSDMVVQHHHIVVPSSILEPYVIYCADVVPPCLAGNNDKGMDLLENSEFSNMNTKIKMQTAEQQRDILRMLEKSLARELDVEKKLAESRQLEEELKLRLHSLEQEVFFMEEEEAIVWERLFEAENAAEVLKGISKELRGRLQIFQFNLNGSMKREGELKSKLQGSTKEVEDKEDALLKLESSSAELHDFLIQQTNNLKASLREAEDKLILSNSEAFTLREKVSSLENQLKESEFQLMNAKASVDGNQEQHPLYSQLSEMKNVVINLKERISKAESRAESAEAKCKLLMETNMELSDELVLLRSDNTTEKVNSLEKQLRESDIQLQHALASAEASLEKQSMLYSTIEDMENLIEDLKLKVSKAESRADCTEEKCIILSESNAELSEELSFLRTRMECLETSLHQAEETKVETAKDIRVRTKVITNLVMQLAFERERLHKQVSLLTDKNKVLVGKLKKTEDPSIASKVTRGEFCPKDDLTTATCAKECIVEQTEFSASSFEMEEAPKNLSVGGIIAGPSDSVSEPETVRRLDPGQLSFKYIFMAVFILLTAAYLFQQQNRQF